MSFGKLTSGWALFPGWSIQNRYFVVYALTFQMVLLCFFVGHLPLFLNSWSWPTYITVLCMEEHLEGLTRILYCQKQLKRLAIFWWCSKPTHHSWLNNSCRIPWWLGQKSVAETPSLMTLQITGSDVCTALCVCWRSPINFWSASLSSGCP